MITIDETKNEIINDIIQGFMAYSETEQFIYDIESEFNLLYSKDNSVKLNFLNETLYYDFKKKKITKDLKIGDCCFRIKTNDAMKIKTIKKNLIKSVVNYTDDVIKLVRPEKRLERFINGYWTGYELSDEEILLFNKFFKNNFFNFSNNVFKINLPDFFIEIVNGGESIEKLDDPLELAIYEYALKMEHLTQFESFNDMIKSINNYKNGYKSLSDIVIALIDYDSDFRDRILLNINEHIIERYIKSNMNLNIDDQCIINHLISLNYTNDRVLMENSPYKHVERLWQTGLYKKIPIDFHYTSLQFIKSIFYNNKRDGNNILIDNFKYCEDEYSFKKVQFSRDIFKSGINKVYVTKEVQEAIAEINLGYEKLYEIDNYDTSVSSNFFEMNKFKYMTIKEAI